MGILLPSESLMGTNASGLAFDFIIEGELLKGKMSNNFFFP